MKRLLAIASVAVLLWMAYAWLGATPGAPPSERTGPAPAEPVRDEPAGSASPSPAPGGAPDPPSSGAPDPTLGIEVDF